MRGALCWARGVFCTKSSGLMAARVGRWPPPRQGCESFQNSINLGFGRRSSLSGFWEVAELLPLQLMLQRNKVRGVCSQLGASANPARGDRSQDRREVRAVTAFAVTAEGSCHS